MWRKSKRPAGGDGISEAPANHRRGNGAAQREAAGTGQPLPRARSGGRDREPGHRGFDRKCTSIAPAPAHPAPAGLWQQPANAEITSCVSQQRGSLLAAAHRVPVTPTNMEKYRETAVAEHEL